MFGYKGVAEMLAADADPIGTNEIAPAEVSAFDIKLEVVAGSGDTYVPGGTGKLPANAADVCLEGNPDNELSELKVVMVVMSVDIGSAVMVEVDPYPYLCVDEEGAISGGKYTEPMTADIEYEDSSGLLDVLK